MGLHPDDAGLTFVARWNVLASALLVQPSVKLVTRTVVDYGLLDGEGIYPGNERLARQTGLTARTVQEAWHFLRATGMAVRENRSVWTSGGRKSDYYSLAIPDNWRSLPMLGPHFGNFTCQQCHKVFNPQPCNDWMTDDRGRAVYTDRGDGIRRVGWRLNVATFCANTRETRNQPARSCFRDWQAAGGQWGGQESWDLYHKARDDDWPKLAALSVVPGSRDEPGQAPTGTDPWGS